MQNYYKLLGFFMNGHGRRRRIVIAVGVNFQRGLDVPRCVVVFILYGRVRFIRL